VRCDRDEGFIDVRGRRVPLDIQIAVAGPVVILHENDEDGLNVMLDWIGVGCSEASGGRQEACDKTQS
jgi:hypothetical protein